MLYTLVVETTIPGAGLLPTVTDLLPALSMRRFGNRRGPWLSRIRVRVLLLQYLVKPLWKTAADPSVSGSLIKIGKPLRFPTWFLVPTRWTKHKSLRAWFMVKSGTMIPLFPLNADRSMVSKLLTQLGPGLRSWLLQADLTIRQLVRFGPDGLPTSGRRAPLTLFEKMTTLGAWFGLVTCSEMDVSFSRRFILAKCTLTPLAGLLNSARYVLQG